jgi:GNAT superfamily N-acetyltransferase
MPQPKKATRATPKAVDDYLIQAVPANPAAGLTRLGRIAERTGCDLRRLPDVIDLLRYQTDRRCPSMRRPPPAPPVSGHAEVRLADGSQMRIRPVGPGDKPRIAAAFAALSEESRYRRFFTPLRELGPWQLAYLTEVDHHDHEALVAIELRSGSCAGVARFVRVADDVAEPAVVVIDRWQRLGLGTVLLELLAERARAERITRFSGVVLAENRDAIGLFEQLGDATREESGRELRFVVVLPAGGGAGATLRELLRAAAAGLLAPARAFVQRGSLDDG